MADIKKLAEELVNLTVKEVNELANVLKEEYGFRRDPEERRSGETAGRESSERHYRSGSERG